MRIAIFTNFLFFFFVFLFRSQLFLWFKIAAICHIVWCNFYFGSSTTAQHTTADRPQFTAGHCAENPLAICFRSMCKCIWYKVWAKCESDAWTLNIQTNTRYCTVPIWIWFKSNDSASNVRSECEHQYTLSIVMRPSYECASDADAVQWAYLTQSNWWNDIPPRKFFNLNAYSRCNKLLYMSISIFPSATTPTTVLS